MTRLLGRMVSRDQMCVRGTENWGLYCQSLHDFLKMTVGTEKEEESHI